MKRLLTLSCLLPFFVSATEMSGALTGFFLTSSESEIDDDFIAVLDLDIEGKLNSGKWHIYLEGTSTSEENKITSTYGESLADAGGAADENGDGRIQFSSVEYYHPVGNGELVIGLLYPSGFTESGDWSNDETTQFVSSPFVNIQTSGAPDYALGIGYQSQMSEQVSYSVLLSQAQGLGDLDAKYSTLFDELDEYFFASEVVWQSKNLSLHSSIWGSTLEQTAFSGGSGKNYGINFSVGYENELGFWLIRYGFANESVSELSDFLALSLQKTMDHWTFGLGISQSSVSNDFSTIADVDDITQIEAYAKYNFHQSFHLTASIQNIKNSGFGELTTIDSDPNILTLRATYEF